MRLAAVPLLLALLGGPGEAQDPAGGYGRLLATVVREDGIDYDALSRDRTALDAYVAWAATADPGATPADRAAFRINAFNAIVLRQVVDAEDPRAWKVAGKDLTLDGLETLLASEYPDPLVHLALHRATRSSPPLSPVLYRGEDLAVALRQQARTFLTDPSRNRFEYAQLTAELAIVFLKHRTEFEAGREGKVPPLQLFLADTLPRTGVATGQDAWADIAESLGTTAWRISFRPDDGALDAAGGKPARTHTVWLVLYALVAAGLLVLGFRAFRGLLRRPPAPAAP